MDEEIKKKNILDLQFQKNLIIASTTVIIMFTYLIGVGIALITKQIERMRFNEVGVADLSGAECNGAEA